MFACLNSFIKTFRPVARVSKDCVIKDSGERMHFRIQIQNAQIVNFSFHAILVISPLFPLVNGFDECY